jgi:hypothetical protein
MILFYLLFYFFIIIKNINSIISQNINFAIVKTPILSVFPKLKLHHIVLLSTNRTNGVYAIDFSPYYQSNKKTLLKLFFGFNVQAEIRIRYLSNYLLNNNVDFIDNWHNMNPKDPYKSKELTNNILENMCNKKKKYCRDYDLQLFIKDIINNWESSMNLYTHNCQHFSNFVKKELMIM